MPDSSAPIVTPNGSERNAPPRLSFAQLCAYGIGNFGVNVANQTPKVLAKPVYNLMFGVSPATIGAAMTISRIVDAVTDPLMGYLSDHTRSRWGRRRPYLVLGSLLTAIAFVALWWCPSGLSSTQMSVYFVVMIVLYYMAHTVLAIPYSALGYEQTTRYEERTRVMAFASFFFSVSGLAYGWAYAASQSAIFPDPVTGLRVVAAVIGVLILVTGIVPALFSKENCVRPPKRSERIPLVKSIRQALSLRPYAILTGSIAFILVGSSLVNGLGLYVMVYHLYAGDTRAASVLFGWYQTGVQLTHILTIFIVPRLARRFGKRNAFIGVILWSGGGAALRWFTYSDAAPYLSLIDVLFFAPVWSSMGILGQSIVADICDLDEVNSGQRREGIFSSVYAWIIKSGMAAAYFVSGLLLVAIGFDAKRTGPQPEETIQLMRLSYMAIPAIAFAVAAVLLSRFPLKQSDVEAARAILDRRKASQSSEPAG